MSHEPKIQQTLDLTPILFAEETAALIQVDENGPIQVENQVGGYGCKHEATRAANVQIIKSFKGLEEHFEQVYSGWCCKGITEKTADFIERGMADYCGFRIDRGKLRESMEAWIHCHFANRPYILTWENSD